MARRGPWDLGVPGWGRDWGLLGLCEAGLGWFDVLGVGGLKRKALDAVIGLKKGVWGGRAGSGSAPGSGRGFREQRWIFHPHP